tara:strand:+ start:212 stop:607 length:396 start_codon:yes stop_codon:yes gene_type:complete
MGYSKDTRSFEQLTPALPKFIIIHDTDSSDILSIPCDNNVIIKHNAGNKLIVTIKEAGHNGTFFEHTKKDCSFTINNDSGALPSTFSFKLADGILAFLTDNNPGSSRVLEILPNTELFGVNTGNIGVDWDV